MKKIQFWFMTTSRGIFFLLIIGLFNPGLISGVSLQFSNEFQDDQPIHEITSKDWYTRARDFSRSGYVEDQLPLVSGQLNTRWKRFLGERIELEMEPIVVGELVYIGVMNGKMYALDKKDGSTVWMFDTGMPITDSPSVVSVVDELVIVFGSSDGSVYALDALNGKKKWVFTTGGPIKSTPSFVNDTIYIGSLDGYFYAINAIDGSLKWRHETSAPIATTSAIGSGIVPGQSGIYVANVDNMAYGFSESGEMVWSKQLSGVYTKRTHVMVVDDVVIVVTRKPGGDYSEPMENRPEILQGIRQPPEIVLDTWADYYIEYPKRRALYYIDAVTGEDLWQPENDKTAFVPLYIPYWGIYMPVADDLGNIYFPATGGGGDHGLDHDIRLWKMDVSNGMITQVAEQDDFMLRFDEVGRPTLVGSRYYQAISEDIGYYDMNTNTTQAVFGNGFGNHRNPLEFSEMGNRTIFGGMHKFFTRFAGSSLSSVFVVADNEAYFVEWGHLYAMTSDSPVPIRDYGELDLVGVPIISKDYGDYQNLLNKQIESIVSSDRELGPKSRHWSWHLTETSEAFWHHGEVVRTLSMALPYLKRDTQNELEGYLADYVTRYLLDGTYYEYRKACLNYDTDQIEDPCEEASIYSAWFWSNPNLVSDRLYALYKYAQNTGDWQLIRDHWDFILERYNGFEQYWNDEAGFYLFPEWHAGYVNFNLQMGAVLALQEMARMVGDQEVFLKASGRLDRMKEMRVYWGKYVRSLYDSGELTRENYDDPEDWGYIQSYQPLPVEGYLDKDNDYRQIYSLIDGEGNLDPKFDFPHDIYPYRLIGYHPILPEFASLYSDNMLDEIQDYTAAVDKINPFWYMGSYSNPSVNIKHEDDTLSIRLSTDMFQTKAYIFDEEFDSLAPYLPWVYEAYGDFDLYRVQNLVALLSSSSKSVCFEMPDRFYCLDKNDI